MLTINKTLAYEDQPAITLLTMAVWGEARGQSYGAKLAVAHTIINRANKPCWWGRTLKQVLLKPYQFSIFNKDDVNYGKLLYADECKAWPACVDAVQKALVSREVDPTKGATHFFSGSRLPSWATSPKLKVTRRVGGFTFLAPSFR